MQESVGRRFFDFGLFNFFGKRVKKIQKRQNSKNRLPTLSCIFYSAHFKLWLRQIGQKMKALIDLARKKFRKKKFLAGTPPQKWKKLKNRNFQKIEENCQTIILSPHWGILGKKWRCCVVRKSKNAKIENRLVPSLRRIRSLAQNMTEEIISIWDIISSIFWN